MEPAIQPVSFIPKKPLTPRRDFSGSLSNLSLLISVAIFIASVAWYFISLEQESSKMTEIKNLQATLEQAQAQFQPNQVINMTRFDSKLKIAKDLLYLDKTAVPPDAVWHTTLLPLLKLISDHTLKNVRFKDFKYDNPDNQKIQIKMSGEAAAVGNIADYAAVAQQAREFSDTRELTNVIVSNLNLGSNNAVTFNVSAEVKPEFVSYTEALSQ